MFLFLESIFSINSLELLSAIAFWFTIVIQVIALNRWRYLEKTQKMIAHIVSLTLINHSLTWFLMVISESNLWVYHLYAPILFILMTRIYRQRLSNFLNEKVFGLLILAFLAFALSNTLFFQSLNVLNSNVIRGLGLISVCYALLYFYFMIQAREDVAPARNPMVWFNSGVMVYYSGTLILFLLVDTVFSEKESVLIASWVLNAVFNLLLLTSYGISLCLKVQK